MERPVDDPLLWHCLPPEELAPALVLVWALLDGQARPLTIAAENRAPLAVTPGMARAFLDVASLLACRGEASLLVVDRHQEISPVQAGEILRVSETVVRHLCLSGELAYRKVGRNRRIGLASLIEYQRRTGGQLAGIEAEFAARATGAAAILPTVDEKRRSKPGAHRKKAPA